MTSRESVVAVQEVNAVTDNAAVLQQRVTKGSNVFLSTLTEPGESQFLTVLKPCGILLPHTHQRANEFYTVIFGAPSNTNTLFTCLSLSTRKAVSACKKTFSIEQKEPLLCVSN